MSRKPATDRQARAERLKAAFAAAGYDSAAAFVRNHPEFGIRPSTLDAHLTGRRNITVEAAKNYAIAFAVSADYLLTGAEDDDGDTPRAALRLPVRYVLSARFAPRSAQRPDTAPAFVDVPRLTLPQATLFACWCADATLYWPLGTVVIASRLADIRKLHVTPLGYVVAERHDTRLERHSPWLLQYQSDQRSPVVNALDATRMKLFPNAPAGAEILGGIVAVWSQVR